MVWTRNWKAMEATIEMGVTVNGEVKCIRQFYKRVDENIAIFSEREGGMLEPVLGPVVGTFQHTDMATDGEEATAEWLLCTVACVLCCDSCCTLDHLPLVTICYVLSVLSLTVNCFLPLLSAIYHISPHSLDLRYTCHFSGGKLLVPE